MQARRVARGRRLCKGSCSLRMLRSTRFVPQRPSVSDFEITNSRCRRGAWRGAGVRAKEAAHWECWDLRVSCLKGRYAYVNWEIDFGISGLTNISWLIRGLDDVNGLSNHASMGMWDYGAFAEQLFVNSLLLSSSAGSQFLDISALRMWSYPGFPRVKYKTLLANV